MPWLRPATHLPNGGTRICRGRGRGREQAAAAVPLADASEAADLLGIAGILVASLSLALYVLEKQASWMLGTAGWSVFCWGQRLRC
jgi:hypothetical protein